MGDGDAFKRMDMLLEAEKILVLEDATISPWRFYGQAYLSGRIRLRSTSSNRTAGGKDYSSLETGVKKPGGGISVRGAKEGGRSWGPFPGVARKEAIL